MCRCSGKAMRVDADEDRITNFAEDMGGEGEGKKKEPSTVLT